MQLRGISAHGVQWFPNCVRKSALTHLVTTWGINLFRVPVYLEASESGYLSNPSYFDSFVQDIVQWCKELGIYVIIDFHVLTKGDPNEYLDSRGASTGMAIDFWTKYATLYKDESHVLYEIANEPNNVAWSTVLDYHNSVINAIRLIDQETIIIAGTTTWSQDIHLAAATPVSKPYNVMYTFHFYAATHGSLYDRVATYINTIPIFVSEWGISAANGGGSYDAAVAQRFLDLFANIDNAILSWTMWSWSDKSETSAILTSPSSCDSETWTAVTCPSRFVENYFKSEDYSLMIACNSSGYVPASSDSTAPFVEEHQWLFWVLGALALVTIIGVVYVRNKSDGDYDDASFQPVAKAKNPEAPTIAYQQNPYNVNESSLPLHAPKGGTSSAPRPSRQRSEPSQQSSPQRQQHFQQSPSGRKSPPRPGQRRQKPSTVNSRNAQQRSAVQMNSSRR